MTDTTPDNPPRPGALRLWPGISAVGGLLVRNDREEDVGDLGALLDETESIVLERTVIDAPPGTFLYNNYNPPLLGLVLRRTTGVSASEYLERELWGPLGLLCDRPLCRRAALRRGTG